MLVEGFYQRNDKMFVISRMSCNQQQLTRNPDLNGFGLECLLRNFRKECRRSKGDRGCAIPSEQQLAKYTLATVAELPIAENIFGINVIGTIAISRQACLGLDAMLHWDTASGVLGTK